MRTYIAGPMRGYDLYNYNAFEAAARALRAEGFEVVSPHEIDIEKDYVSVDRDADGWFTRVDLKDSFTMQKALGWDFLCIIESDAICMLSGWRKSEGARNEAFVAAATGKNFFLYTEDGHIRKIPTPQQKLVAA